MPILAMVQVGSWRMLYGGRSRNAMPFVSELRALKDDRSDIVPRNSVRSGSC
jgi:hypothetical protein